MPLIVYCIAASISFNSDSVSYITFYFRNGVLVGNHFITVMLDYIPPEDQ